MRLVLFADGRSVGTYIATWSSWSYRPAECSYRYLAKGITFSYGKCSSTTILYFFTWNSNQLLSLNIFFFFFFRLFYLSTRFISVLTFTSFAIHWLTCFRVSSGLFLVLFWMLWMLVTVHKLCHVPHASRITTCGTIFTERHFSVSKEWVRSWSHAFLITSHKTLIKKLSGEKENKNKKN